MAQQIKAHAEKRGMTAAQFALNWVRSNKLVTSVLVGPRTEAQWSEYLAALKFKLADEDEALIDQNGQSGAPVYTWIQRSPVPNSGTGSAFLIDQGNFAMTCFFRLVLAIALAGADTFAAAQGATSAYPNRPVRLVVPLPAGGGVDWLARVLAQKLTESPRTAGRRR